MASVNEVVLIKCADQVVSWESISLPIFTGSVQGKKHAENEDHLFVRELTDWDGMLFGVADGIGSHPFGEIRSATFWIPLTAASLKSFQILKSFSTADVRFP